MVRVICAAFAVILVASLAGCGSDDPPLKDLSEADRAAQQKTAMEYQKKAQESGSGANSKAYQDSVKKSTGS